MSWITEHTLIKYDASQKDTGLKETKKEVELTIKEVQKGNTDEGFG